MLGKLTSWVLILLGVCILTLVVLSVVRWLRYVQYRNLLERIDRIETELASQAGTDTTHARDAASLVARARFLKHKLKAATDHAIPSDLVKEFDDDLGRWRKGDPVFPDKRGPILKGYLSDIDGSIQTYSVNVPESFLGDHSIPLLVHLHGHGWFAPFQGHPASSYTGAITLAPQGRGATDYLSIGELDVLQAIDEVRRDYPIDDTRIYVTGSSMGGTGSWTLAVHHPDLFAGVAPRAANADYRAWESRWNWNPADSRLHLRLRQFLRDLDNPLTYAENLAGMPVYCLHNAGDEVVPVEHARAMVDAVRAAGADCRYLEFLTGTHADFDESAVSHQLAWIATHHRRPPRKVAFVTGTLRQGRVAWVRVDGFAEPLKLAKVHAEISPDNSLLITCDNVSSLVLTPPGVTAPARILVNGAPPLRVPASPDGVFRLHLQAGRWTPGPPDDKLLRKRPGLEGPVDEVFLAPFILVYGTQGGDPAQLRALKDEADRFADEWKRRYGAPPRQCPDTDLTPADVQRFNLVLFGRPDQNSVLSRFADRLPIRIAPDSIQAFGARYAAPDVGTIFCYPNPESPDRMLVVYAALGEPGYDQIHTRFDKWFNWGVLDFHKWFDYALFGARTRDPETFLNVGFFDQSWTYDPACSFPGVPELRSLAPPRNFPRLSHPPSDENVVYLSDLRPLSIDQMRGSLELDRSFRGEPIILDGSFYRRGLGVRTPSTLKYNLGRSFSTFRAVVGLATEDAQPDSPARRQYEAVRFVVLGDDKTLWQSEPVDWKSPTAHAVVSVKGVRTLELRVVPERRWLWLHGSTAWADARLIRR